MLHLLCLQHSITALRNAEPTGKYSTFIVLLFLLKYYSTFFDLCWVALPTIMINLLNFFFTLCRYAMNDWPSNISFCLKSYLPYKDSTPYMIVFSWSSDCSQRTFLSCDPFSSFTMRVVNKYRLVLYKQVPAFFKCLVLVVSFFRIFFLLFWCSFDKSFLRHI
jgi:hypothetical protein